MLTCVFLGKVALHNSFITDGVLSVDFKLNKGLIALNFQGINVFLESSGDVGYYIDVLVRSSWNHDKTVEIIDRDIMRALINVEVFGLFKAYCGRNVYKN